MVKKLALLVVFGFALGVLVFTVTNKPWPNVAKAQSVPETNFSLLIKSNDKDQRIDTTNIGYQTNLTIPGTLRADEWECHVMPKEASNTNMKALFQTLGCTNVKHKFFFGMTTICYTDRHDTDTQRLGIGSSNTDSAMMMLSCSTSFNGITQHF